MGLVAGFTVVATLFAPRGMASWLLVGPDTLSGLRLTALVTNSLIEISTSVFGYVFVLALGAFFLQQPLRMMWHQRRNDLISLAAALIVLPLILSIALPNIWGLAASMVLLVWFAPGMEARWGPKRLWIFLLIVAVATNLVGALLLWISLGTVSPLIGGGATPLAGTTPLIDALFTAWALSLGRQRLAILNIEGYKLVYVLLAFGALHALLTGFAFGMMQITAVVTAWMLIKGTWHPRLLMDQIRLLLIKRRRQKMRVVPGGKSKGKGGPTLHRQFTGE